MKKLNFNEHFKITTSTDYVNILLVNDLELFIDPYCIANNQHEKIAAKIYSRMKSFFENLNRTYVQTNDRKNGLVFLSHLHEPNEYGFGYSDNNKGKAISRTKAEIIYDALSNNKFAKAGVSITNEAHNVLLLVKGIGQDNMSDVIANVCRDIFAEYTHDQCSLHGIKTSSSKIEFYDDKIKNWALMDVSLPQYLTKSRLLVPKILVQNKHAYTAAYNWFISSNRISAGILNGTITPPSSSSSKPFVTTLKSGEKKAIIKRINEHYKKPKEKLVDFVTQFNGSLEDFQIHIKKIFPDLTDEFLSKILSE